MKALLILACACLLCSCSSAPVMLTSFNGYRYSSDPTGPNDPRARHPQFYMDESDSIPWLHGTQAAGR